MTEGSFQFLGKNSVDDFGIYVRQYIPVSPNKRIRKSTIPYRHGSYNYGVKAYEEIEIVLECFCAWDFERDDFRRVSAWLSKPGNLTFWDEPDKFYKGEFEAFSNIDEFNLLRMKEFQLSFIAYPFAFSQRRSEQIREGINRLTYAGTVEQPAYLRLINNSGQIINGVQISLVYLED